MERREKNCFTFSFFPFFVSCCWAQPRPAGIEVSSFHCNVLQQIGLQLSWSISLCFRCIAENGVWNEWGEFGSCSGTCGGGSGQYVRARNCDNPPPSDGGLDCPGNATDIAGCTNDSPCSGNANPKVLLIFTAPNKQFQNVMPWKYVHQGT